MHPGLSADAHCIATAFYRCWLLLGTLLVLALPAARSSDAVIGWLPLWFVVLPACSLVVLDPQESARGVRDVLRRMAKRVK